MIHESKFNKTEVQLCRHFQLGKCKLESACKFSHEIEIDDEKKINSNNQKITENIFVEYKTNQLGLISKMKQELIGLRFKQLENTIQDDSHNNLNNIIKAMKDSCGSLLPKNYYAIKENKVSFNANTTLKQRLKILIEELNKLHLNDTKYSKSLGAARQLLSIGQLESCLQELEAVLFDENLPVTLKKAHNDIILKIQRTSK